MGENSFELSIPPFLKLHPVFNVELLWPYFPLLLDNSEVSKHLAPTKLNHDYIEKETINQVMETQMNGTRPT